MKVLTIIMDDNERDDFEKEVIDKTWQKVSDTLYKAGYREGAEKGRETSLQNGFDKGYKEGFTASVQIARLKGMASVLRKEDNLSGAEDHYQFWKNPLKDLCLLCDKDKITSDNTCQSTDLSEMVLKQQIIISQELEEEEKRNIELFKKFGISSET